MSRGVRVTAIRRNRLALAVTAALVPFTQATQAQVAANTLPTGGQVTAGTASISQPGAGKMQIDQASDKAILQWQSFSIGSGAWVNFTQPSASSVALNRVMGNNPSQIFGRLSANGRVFLTNPNGVLFAPGASVDVGALFATTLSITDRDFLAGNYNFYNAGSAGGVTNQGVITATDYAALAGPQVRNEGVIVAHSGTVALAAGDRVSLDMIGDGLISVSVDQAAMNASALNAGRIEADGGRVVLTARSANALLDTVVNNSGVVRANSLLERDGEIVLDGGSAGVVANSGTLQAASADSGTKGGGISLSGDKVSIEAGGVVDVSGEAGGGTVEVGGNATGTYVGPDAAIHADAIASGAGGVVKIAASDATRVYGAVTALGASGGKGGAVETSGGYLEVTQAPQVGAGGSWLIDPYNIHLVSGTTSSNTGAPDFTPTGDDSQIDVGLIDGRLDAGSNVTIDTGSAGGQLGDISVDAAIAKTSINGAGLALNAAHDISVNAGISLNSGGFTANAGNNMTVTNVVDAGTVNINTGNVLTLNASGGQDAQILSHGGQTVSAEGLVLHAQDVGNARLWNFGGDQDVAIRTLGIELSAAGGEGRAQIRNETGGGAQTVSTTGALNVAGGGRAFIDGFGWISGVLQFGGGTQSVSAASISLRASDAGFNGGAQISDSVVGGEQRVTTAGALDIKSGGSGQGNRAGISSNGTQSITSGAISVTGGDNGTGTAADLTSNGAYISANNGAQTIEASSITLQAGLGGQDTFAAITAASQVIAVSGDVVLNGGGGFGASNGARIGGPGGAVSGPTNLTLNARNVTLQGGSATGVGLGSAPAGQANDITVNATGDVSLTSNGGGGVRIGYGPNDPSAGHIVVHADGDVALSATGRGAVIRSTEDVTLSAGGSITETGNTSLVAGTLVTNSTGATLLGTGNQVTTFTGTSGGEMVLNNFGNLSVTAINAYGGLTLTNSGMLSLSAAGGQDSTITSLGGQSISAYGLALHAQDNGVAYVNNFGGDQSISAGSGGVDLDVVNSQGVAQITNYGGTGTQSVQASGAVNIVGGSTTTGFVNSGIFQNQSGTQSVTAGSISLRGGDGGSNAGAYISAGGGADQVITVAGGLISVGAGDGGFGNRAVIAASGNQTINGSPDILVAGGASGGGTFNGSQLSNSATIMASRTQTIDAGSITVNAGAGGNDTFATITGQSQIVSATGDVALNGSNGNTGSANGARIGGPGGPTNLTLSANNVTLNDGLTSGVALGASPLGAAQPNNIFVDAAGNVTLNATKGTAVRIGGTPANGVVAGNISIHADGNIALNGIAGAASIRTTDGVTLDAGQSIAETGNAFITAGSLSTSSGTTTSLGGLNQVSSYGGSSGSDFLLNNSGALSVSGISAGTTLALFNAGALGVTADGADTIVSAATGQTISAGSISLVGQNGGRAILVNASGDQQVTATAGGIDLIGVNGTGLAKIVNGLPGFAGVAGSQTVSASGALNVVGGAVGVGPRLTNSGISENTIGTQTVTAASISLRGSDFGNNGAALVTNEGGGGDQSVTATAGGITLQAGGGTGAANRAVISTFGDQAISASGAIELSGGANGSGSGSNGNSAQISTSAARTQTIHAGALTLNAGTGGVDTFAAMFGGEQHINVSGDVTLNGGGASGSARGARIGGASGSATNLTLSAHNVTLNDGLTSGVGLGSSPNGAPQPNNISVDATGDVTLNASQAAGVHIGGTPVNGIVGGDISIQAAGNIALNGIAGAASIRTTDSVTLDAGQSIAETGNAFITAGSLTTTSGTSTSLGGPNQVSAFSGTGGGDMVFNNLADLSVIGISAGGTLSLTNSGTLSLTASGGSDALISSFGGQTIEADSLVVHAQNGSLARIINIGGNQTVNVGPAGIDLTVLDGQGSAQIVNAKGAQTNGTQTVSTAGLLNVVGGATSDFRGTNSGVFQSQTGKQTVSAGSIDLQGANAPVTLGGAMITSFDGGPTSNQEIDVASGAIRLAGGDNGVSNRAVISAGGSQTINGNPDIVVTGGSGGTGNSAQITASGTQTISAGNITVAAGAGGNNTFAIITGASQIIDAAGDVEVDGGGGFGTANGARIGGTGATNLTLSARNVTLTAGTTTGVGLGSSSSAALPNTITVNATGNVTLNGGDSGTAGARIGSSAQTATTGGSIHINAGGNIALNGATLSAAVRTLGDVTLKAGTGSITENANGLIVAGTLTTQSGMSTLLGGPNQVSTFNANSGADLLLANVGTLNVTGLSTLGSATLDNTGDVTVSGTWTTGGTTSITVHSDLVLQNLLTASDVVLDATTGALREEGAGAVASATLTTTSAGDTLLTGANQISAFSGTSGGNLSLTNVGNLLLGGPVNSGAMNLNVLGALDVRSIVSSNGGQSVTAQSLSVTADGGTAQLSNVGGDQSITVAGGAMDVRTAGAGGFASITNSGGGQQSIALVDGDHIAVNGASGLALIQSDAGQVLSATGSGANAIRIGSDGALGPTIVLARAGQDITAGAAGEAGSISIVGAAGQNALTGFLTNPAPGGTQTISTTGQISIQGGSAAAQNFNTPAGIFHNGSGQQTINAAGISLAGGNAGNTNAALINALGGGVPANAANQVFNVGADGIRIAAGAVGSGNRAGIFGSATQTFNVDGDITITGGAGGSGFASDSTSNNAFISDSGASGVQTINARNITINAGAGGSDTFAAIVGGTQVINATDDVVLNGGGGFGTANGARIGGRGGQSTNLSLTAGNVILNGGATTGAALGSSGTGTPQSNDVMVSAAGNVALNASAGAGTRIGYGPNGPAGGSIRVHADGDISLNGNSTQGAAVRTTDAVNLDAGGSISESGNGFVAANGLTTSSVGSTLLGGPNGIAMFNATSGGDVLLDNTGVLNVTGLSAVGNATLDNVGDVTISGPWTAGGATSITVHSNLFLESALTSQNVFLIATSGSIEESGSGSIDAQSLTTSSVGDTTLDGDNTVSTFSASSDTGTVLLSNTGPLQVTSIEAPGGFELSNEGPVTLPASVDIPLTLAAHGDLNLTHSIQAPDLTLRSDTGNITIGGADTSDATVLYAADSLTVSAPGAVVVRGSDCAPGAGAYLLAGGLLDVHAGSFSLVGGAAPFAPAVAAGNVVNVSTVGDLTLTGGSGWFSPALLLGGMGIDLTVGGKLKIDGITETGSFARVQTATSDGAIHITFTNESGDYVVDGLDGRIKHGEDGFYTGLQPAKPGDTLSVDYE